MSLRRKMEKTYLEERGLGSGRRFVADLVSAVGSDDTLLDIGCVKVGCGRVWNPVQPISAWIDILASVMGNTRTGKCLPA